MAWDGSWSRGSRVLAPVLAAGLLVTAASRPVLAHPHVWVKVETTVLFNNGTITGLQQKWTFDEFYTLMAVQGLDTNNDGVYSRDELAELAKVNIDALTQFGFYTHARLGSQPLKVAPAGPYWLEHGRIARPAGMPASAPPADGTSAPAPTPQVPKPEAKPGFFGQLGEKLFGKSKESVDDGKAEMLSLVFTVNFAQPVLAEAPDFSFAVYDPEFFIAFDVAGETPVKLGAGAPADCRVERIETPEADRLGESFTQQFGTPAGFGASKPVKVVCGPRT